MKKSKPFLSALLLLLLSACNLGGNDQTPTPFQPTEMLITSADTPEPMVARVNGEGILLTDYQAELLRYQAGQADPSLDLTSEDQYIVLDSMINELLLVQGAVANGYALDDAGLEQRLADLIQDAGGEANYSTWLSNNFYAPDDFEKALRRAVEAAWMRDQISTAMPTEVEQVHARQILLLSQDLADQVFAQLESGVTFQTLAEYYDPLTGGDLGWFPRGYITQPLVEEAAFGLQPDEHSSIIETDFGYHIIQVVERSPNRALTGDVLALFQRQAVDTWVTEQRASSTIEILIP